MRREDVLKVKAGATARGCILTWSEAEKFAGSLEYLRARGRRLPTNPQETEALDPDERRAMRVLLAILVKRATNAPTDRYQQMLVALQPAERAEVLSVRAPSEPFNSWSPPAPRGVFSKRDWRQKAA